MEIIDKMNNLKGSTILKFIGLALIVLVAGAFLVQVLGATLFYKVSKTGNEMINSSKGGNFGSMYSADKALPTNLSMRNLNPAYEEDGSTGNTAEDLEVTQYSGLIETGKLEETCAAVSALKAKDYVIFENANEDDRSCNYVFKVESAHSQEILAVIQDLNPKELTENTQTIKKRVDDFTSELEILNRKKETIEQTLEDAVNSYDEIAKVATQARDAESLAKIIDSKVRIIEKLSQDRININAQLDRLNRSKAEQLDRLDYTFFRINVYENKFIDQEAIKDSWKAAVKRFVNDINNIAQNISINLITSLFIALQIIIYLALFILLAKLVWRLALYIWKK